MTTDPAPTIMAHKAAFRPEMSALDEYEPILPVEVLSQRYGVPPEQIVKLDGNENPYGCSPRVRKLLAQAPVHLYPDPEHREARHLLAAYVGMGAEHIVLGNGSDELIDLVVRLTLRPGERVLDCVPTFGMYRFYTQLAGGEVVAVPRDGGYDVDVAAVKARIDGRTRILFLAAPNNPTGNPLSLEALGELLATGLLVVLDEAYYEFSGLTAVPWVAQHENLVVLRTFSKWAGLAGLRVGYGIFPTPISRQLWRIKSPYNVNAAAQWAVCESLKDAGYLQENVRRLVAERERLYRALGGISFLEPFPSAANFVYCRVHGRSAAAVHEALARRGIMVRYFDTSLLRQGLRISVGKPEHTEALLAALGAIEKEAP